YLGPARRPSRRAQAVADAQGHRDRWEGGVPLPGLGPAGASAPHSALERSALAAAVQTPLQAPPAGGRAWGGRLCTEILLEREGRTDDAVQGLAERLCNRARSLRGRS